MSVPSIYMIGSHIIGNGAGIFALPSGGGSGSPLVLYTDIVSGSRVNGENGKGSYLSIFGLNFGTFANLGTSSGAQVFIGGIQVDNYRGLDNSTVYSLKPGFPAIQRLVVQIGALTGLTNGTAYALSIVVNGVASNTTDVRGNALTFTPNPGNFWFVDTVNGSDSTGILNDITHPFRYIQHYSGSSPVSPSVIPLPGDTIVIRGNGGTPIQDQVGFDNRLMRWNTTGGSAPTGSSGSGWIHFTAYPGAALANAMEDVYYLCPSGGDGGFMGTGTAHGSPSGSAGQYWSCSNMRADAAGTCGSTDASAFNLQNSSNNCRMVNLNVQWNTTSTNMLIGGINGNGNGISIFGCHIYNISGSPSGLECHGIYMDGSNICAQNVEIGFNVIEQCNSGQLIQFHNTASTPTGFFNIYVHHNWTEVSAKYGFKFDDWDGTNGPIWSWNNVIIGTQREAIQVDGSSQASGANMHFENNTIWNCYLASAGYLLLVANEGSALTGTITFNNNIFAFAPGRSNNGQGFVDTSSGFVYSGNLYYDYSGFLTSKPSGDTAGIYASPLFTNAVTGSLEDLTLQATSNALNRAVSATINPTNDLGMNPNPRPGKVSRSVGGFA
jgi:hypothetical protein